MNDELRKIVTGHFDDIIDDLPDGYLLLDDRGNICDVNTAYCKMTGFTREELLNMQLNEISPAISEENQQLSVKEWISAGGVRIETYHKTKDSKLIEVAISSVSFEEANQNYLVGFVRDITEEKKMAAKLKRSEQKWQHLVEKNPHPVQVTIDGEIVFINQAGAKLYGAENSQQLIGMSVFKFCHPDYLDKIEERKYRLENDLPVDNIHEHKILRIDGKSRYVEVNSISVDYQGEQAIQTVLFDITERKEKESIIEDSLKEKEVLLKEIHHRVKNNMAVISGLLELQAMNASDQKLKDLLKQSQLRISSMAMVHEKLYQTENFSDLGFDEYVGELVESIKKTVNGATHNVAVDYNLEPVSLSITKAIPAALIINEVVVNSYKHAFHDGESGLITINVTQDEDLINVQIEDDGIGFPDGFDFKRQSGLGINLIQTLVKQLEGELTISSKNGVSFDFSFPRNGENS